MRAHSRYTHAHALGRVDVIAEKAILQIVVYNVNNYPMERWCNWNDWCTQL